MDRHTKLSKEIATLSSSSMTPVTNVKAKAIIESNMKRMSRINQAYADLTVDSEEEATDTESYDEEFYKRIGRSNAYVAIESSKNFSESDNDSNASSDDDSSNDEPITFCLMKKSSKDQVSAKHLTSMNEYSPEYVSYAKLVKIAKSQHDELEMIERNLRKTEGLLVEEMKKNQKLIEEQDAFSPTIDDLTIQYDSLSVDYEGLANELLNRNQEPFFLSRPTITWAGLMGLGPCPLSDPLSGPLESRQAHESSD